MAQGSKKTQLELRVSLAAPYTAYITSAAHVLRIPLRQQLRRCARCQSRGTTVTRSPASEQEALHAAAARTKR